MKRQLVQKILLIVIIICSSFIIGLYLLAFIMKDKANNIEVRNSLRDFAYGPHRTMNFIGTKFVGTNIFDENKFIVDESLSEKQPEIKIIEEENEGVITSDERKNEIENEIIEIEPEVILSEEEKLLLEDKKIEENMEREYSELDYTFEEPYIKLDPYGRTPLSALLKFSTDEPVKISLSVLGKDGKEFLKKEFEDFKMEHEYPVLGLYANEENRIALSSQNKSGDMKSSIIKIKTEKLSRDSLKIKSLDMNKNKKNLKSKSKEMYSVSSHGYSPFSIFDIEGLVRYELKNSELYSHTVLTYRDYYIVGKSQNNKLLKLSKLGKIEEIYDLDKYQYHHDLFLKDDRYLIIPVDNKEMNTVEDFIIVYDLQDKKIIKEFDLREILDLKRDIIEKSEKDWLHVNSVFYDSKDNSLLISARHQGLFKIDYDSGELIWLATIKDGFHDKSVEEKVLRIVGKNRKQFRWPIGQHDAEILPNGNIFLFNNNGTKYGKDREDKRYSDSFSSGIEYKVDKKKMTIEMIRQYGLNEKIYSGWISGVDYDKNTGNRLVLWGDSSRESENLDAILIEYKENGEKLQEYFITNHPGLYRADFVDNLY